jgi:spore protease
MDFQTDLALEATELWQKQAGDPGRLSGVTTREYKREGFLVTEVKVLNEEGAEAVGKPVGTYLTLELGAWEERSPSFFFRCAEAISGALKALLPEGEQGCALVVGLGNRAVTPDAIGAWAVEKTVVTRHLITHIPEAFDAYRPVAAVAAGVLGTTGLESGELVQALCQQIHPSVIIAVDALAARSASRLCTTIQLADTGIVPGSGVGNARFALTEESLGIPVLAVGVPTVVRAGTLAADLGGSQQEQGELKDLFVTTKDIDTQAAELAKSIGYGVSMALQDGVTVEDVELLLY